MYQSIGFDDLIVSRACRPRLTTMHYPVEEMASYATKLAIQLSDTSIEPESRTHLFIPQLVREGFCGRCASQLNTKYTFNVIQPGSSLVVYAKEQLKQRGLIP